MEVQRRRMPLFIVDSGKLGIKNRQIESLLNSDQRLSYKQISSTFEVSKQKMENNRRQSDVKQ
jgi:hypothetical protein